MKTAVVYYSKNGNTRFAANIIAEKTQGVLIELKEKRMGNPLQAMLKLCSKLSGTPWEEIVNANKVYLLAPIWAGRCTPAMNTFVKRADFGGKEVVIVTVQADPNLKNNPAVTKTLAGRIAKTGGKVMDSFGLCGEFLGKCKSEKDMKAQIEKTGKFS